MTPPRQRASWHTNGYPNFTGVPDVPEYVRFWAKVDKLSSPTGCWLWLAKKVRSYGQFQRDNGTWIQAPRWAYMERFGALGPDLVPDHVVCHNPTCVNPDHMEAVTQAINRMRVLRKIVCKSGHQLLGANVYVTQRQRVCRVCKREWAKKNRQTK